jgi:23S rRNA maturation-related 3'-5' exoribonuclease YhaM
MDRLEIFKTELDYIKNEKIRRFTEATILKLPDYFFTIAASTSGRYHPKFSLGDGGLIRHTQVAVRIAVDILNLEMMNYSELEKDIIIASLILHDGMKCGENGTGTVLLHPVIMADFIGNDSELNTLLDADILELIRGCISTHMGQWRYDYKDKYKKNPLLPKLQGKHQSIVHLCDYLSSRKYFAEFDFNINISRG